MSENTQQPVADADPQYTSVADYMAYRDGEMSLDDVRVDPEVPAAPEPPPSEPTGQVADDGGGATAPAVVASDEPEAPKPAVAERKTRAQRRVEEIQTQIATLTATKHRTQAEVTEAQSRLDALKAEEARLTRRIAEQGRPTAPAPTAAADPRARSASASPRQRPVPPKIDDVGSEAIPTWDDYARLQAKWQDDMADWTTQEAARIARESVGQALQEDRVVASWDAQMAAARAKYQDFDQVALSDDVVISPALAGRIVRDTVGAEVAYHLGKHPDEAKRIAALPPEEQLVEYGAIRARVSTPRQSAAPTAGPAARKAPAPTAPAIPRSQAPAPISPVGAAPTASKVPLESRSLSDYIDSRNAEEDRYRRR